MKCIAVIMLVWVASCTPDSPGPLRVSKENPRYFTDGTGKAIYLAGAHTWNNLVDMKPRPDSPPFDYEAYLNFMSDHHLNFMRLWTWELLTYNTSANSNEAPKVHHISPHPWMRTGPGTAVDGQPKFDLTKFDDAYFERMRQRIIAAGKRNIYVSIMLFEGWGIQFGQNAYHEHPFHPLNTITSLALDTANDKRLQVHELVNTQVLAVQEAYVKKVIATVNDLDNVLYEISNENHGASTAWQYHMINFIKANEKALTKQHPVGMTFQFEGGTNAQLFASPADWISPNGDGGYRDAPTPSDGRKVILNDTDHLWGIGGNHAWVWMSFMQGLNPIFMDPYDGRVLYEGYESKALKQEIALLRKNLGYTHRFADKVDLMRMQPAPRLSSTGYCLANAGHEYLVYIREGRSATVDLTGVEGTVSVSWFDPLTGESKKGDDVQAQSKVKFDSPFTTPEAVLHLKH